MPKIPWPLKLFEAANDPCGIIKWNQGGTAIVVDDQRYEREVMVRWPDLVAIPSFNNLRRQLRQYSFDYSLDSEHNDNSLLEFSNPFFLRGRPDLLQHVVCRKKGEPMKRSQDNNDYSSQEEGTTESKAKKRLYRKRRCVEKSDAVTSSSAPSLDSSFDESELPSQGEEVLVDTNKGSDSAEDQEDKTAQEDVISSADTIDTVANPPTADTGALRWPLNPYAYIPTFYQPVTPPSYSWPGMTSFWPSPPAVTTPPAWMMYPMIPLSFSPPQHFGYAGCPVAFPVSVPLSSSIGSYGQVPIIRSDPITRMPTNANTAVHEAVETQSNIDPLQSCLGEKSEDTVRELNEDAPTASKENADGTANPADISMEEYVDVLE